MEEEEPQTRNRSATVSGAVDSVKTELSLFKLADSGRTSSDSALTKSTPKDGTSTNHEAGQNATDAPANNAPPSTSPEQAIAAARALREEQESCASAVNGDVSSASQAAAQKPTSASDTPKAAADDAGSDTAAAVASSSSTDCTATESTDGGVHSRVRTANTNTSSASPPPSGKGGSTLDPWLQQPISEEAAVAHQSHRDSRTRFFAFPIGRSDAVATRVSRWMPFDSASDAKAATKRASAEWWQMPEQIGAATAASATAGSGTGAGESGEAKTFAPTNPFAADVNGQAAMMPGESTDEASTSGPTAAAAAATVACNTEAASVDAAVDHSKKEAEISPAEDGEVAPKATTVAAPKKHDSVPLDQKETASSWKLMLKSALLTHSANRDKHSNAVEFHEYIIILKDGKLCIYHVPEFFRELGNKATSLEEQVGKRQPLMEMRLEAAMRFGPVERKRVIRDSRTRLHITKLQSWQQREFHGIRALFGASSRTEVRTVLKIGSASLTALESVMEACDKAIRSMPVDTAHDITFRRDEVFCDLVDDCDVYLAFDGTLLSRRSTIHVMVQGYLSGQTDCQLALNDRQLANERRNNPSGLFLPPSKDVIEMHNIEFHSATDRDAFDATRLVRFACIQGLRFEALRFQVTGSLPPPLEVRGLLCEIIENAVNLRVNLRWHQQTGRVRFAVHDIEFHFPVPSDWSGVLETKNALGMRRSIKAKNSLRGSFRRKRQTAQASLDVSVGSAKYEPESEALVWRIDDFPTDRDANAQLTCRLELPPTMEKADFSDKQCIMRYGVAGSCVSGASVWSLQIPTVQHKLPKKWVKYDTKFKYVMDMMPSSKYEIAGEDD